MASLRRSLVTVRRLLNSTPPVTNRSSISPIPSQSASLREYGFFFSRFSTLNNADSESNPIDLSNHESRRRLCNRLLYRSRQRGYLELDLVLGKWVEEHVHSMDENRIKALIHVLDLVLIILFLFFRYM
ncbi:Succinate dehydrogenase assembly factor 2, mitochondrial [Linum grandiflorum]